jgi:hypothetical protein
MPAEFRGYRAGDERQLVELFGRVFGRAISEAHWLWKFKGLPSPAENVWLGVVNEEVVFQYACIPTPFRLPDGERLAMVSADAMTAVPFRRMGLLTEGARRAYRGYQAAGASFVIGLPNQAWGTRTEALGWERLFPLCWLTLPLRPERLLAARLAWPWLGSLTWVGALWNRLLARRSRSPDPALAVRPITAASEAFDELWHESLADSYLSVVRNRDWIDWRYFSCPSFDYQVLLAERAGRPVGYAVYRWERDAGRHLGVIAELVAPRTEAGAWHALLESILGMGQHAHADSLVTLAVPGSPAYAALRRFGYIPRRRSFDVMMVDLDPALPLAAMRDPSRWLMAGGDFDVV